MSESERRRPSVSRRTVTIAVPTIAALGAGGAFAAASIPGGDGTINACYVTNGGLRGAVRLIDDTASCTKFETSIKWNQQGPQGPMGPMGPQGPKGDKGDTGPAGANGTESILIGGEALNAGRAVGFLELDGIKGESTDKAHADEIDIKSFSFGVKNPNAGSIGGGGGSSRATFSTFHFNKLYDASSPKLLTDAVAGEHIKSATFTFRRPGADGQDFLSVKLTNVAITDYEQGGTQEPPLLEGIDLTAEKAQVTYRPQNADGSLGDPIQANIDLNSSKA